MDDREYAALLDDLRGAVASLAEQLRAVPAGRWDDTVFAGENGWTRRQLLAHMASNDLRQITRVRIGAGIGNHTDEAMLAAQLEPDGWNQQQVEQRRGRSVEELLAELQTHRNALIALLESLTAEQRAREMPFRGGKAELSTMLPAVSGHLSEHAREIAG